jgi:hypothetical protein
LSVKEKETALGGSTLKTSTFSSKLFVVYYRSQDHHSHAVQLLFLHFFVKIFLINNAAQNQLPERNIQQK